MYSVGTGNCNLACIVSYQSKCSSNRAFGTKKRWRLSLSSKWCMITSLITTVDVCSCNLQLCSTIKQLHSWFSMLSRDSSIHWEFTYATSFSSWQGDVFLDLLQAPVFPCQNAQESDHDQIYPFHLSLDCIGFLPWSWWEDEGGKGLGYGGQECHHLSNNQGLLRRPQNRHPGTVLQQLLGSCIYAQVKQGTIFAKSVMRLQLKCGIYKKIVSTWLKAAYVHLTDLWI